MNGPTLKRKVYFNPGRRGAKTLGTKPKRAAKPLPPPVPREARLMAFAIVFDEWLAAGKVKDYTELAEITGMDRSAVTRIMNLRLLEPRKQENLLQSSR